MSRPSRALARSPRFALGTDPHTGRSGAATAAVGGTRMASPHYGSRAGSSRTKLVRLRATVKPSRE